MGAALELLSAMERKAIAQDILSGVGEAICQRHGTATALGAYCPLHSERSPGGAFRYDYERDWGHCYSCGQGADLIGLWNVTQGRDQDDPEGFRLFVKAFGQGHKLSPGQRRGIEGAAPQAWAPRRREFAPRIWRTKATAFALDCAARLQQDAEALEKLRTRWGILRTTAGELRMGLNPDKVFRPYTSWGLPYAENHQGRERCIYLPPGLVLPWFVDGEVVQLKIRQDEPEHEGGSKYREIPGSETRYMVLGDPARVRHWVVLETERDAMLVFQELRALGLGVMATRSTSHAPDEEAHEILTRAELILVGVDNDQAGARMAWNFAPRGAWRFAWNRVYPQAVRWPVPRRLGKDQGDLVGQLAIRDWALAGLPGHVLRRQACQVRKLGFDELPTLGSDEYGQLLDRAMVLKLRLRVDGLGRAQLIWPEAQGDQPGLERVELAGLFERVRPELERMVG
ncbi:MAG: hypothetical protein KKE73_08575 [Proteobacteria bacterium]|nr:hypothetical protein [Pseudomonadota bacterium]